MYGGDVAEDAFDQIYSKLKSGELNLKDLACHFSNGIKDEWLLGMVDRIGNEW